MTFWERIKCGLFGICGVRPKQAAHPLVEQMARNVEETRQLKQTVRHINESGIWPRDMVTGVYRPRTRRSHDRS